MKVEIRIPGLGLNYAATQMLVEVLGSWEYLDFDGMKHVVGLCRAAKKDYRDSVKEKSKVE